MIEHLKLPINLIVAKTTNLIATPFPDRSRHFFCLIEQPSRKKGSGTPSVRPSVRPSVSQRRTQFPDITRRAKNPQIIYVALFPIALRQIHLTKKRVIDGIRLGFFFSL
jgi:hypothetical protein